MRKTHQPIGPINRPADRWIGWSRRTPRSAVRMTCWSSAAIAWRSVRRLIRRACEAHERLAGAQSPGRLAAQGIDVYNGPTTFTGHDCLEVEGRTLRFRRAIIATAARSAAAKIGPGEQPECLTSESLLELTKLPQQLAVVGSDGDACRWAQTFARLGSEVHLLAQQADQGGQVGEPLENRLELVGEWPLSG